MMCAKKPRVLNPLFERIRSTHFLFYKQKNIGLDLERIKLNDSADASILSTLLED